MEKSKSVIDFENYIKQNKDKLDTNKLKSLSKEQQKVIFNEWKWTWSIANSYFKPVTNTIKPTTTITTSPMDTLKNKYSMGNKSEWNTNLAKVDSTLSAVSDVNKQLGKEKEKEFLSKWKEQSSVVTKANADDIQRAKDNQATIDSNKQRDYESNEERRKEADDLLRRQEAIASRQANISAANAWASGIKLSDDEINEIKNDTIAKYWVNLSNAEQFRNKTNMELDQALQSIDQSYFGNKTSIDTLLKNLNDEEIKPLINALDKATEWNIQAIDDVKTYYNTLSQKKWEEEMNRGLKEERLADQENIWKSWDKAKKLALLQDEFKEAGIMDVYIGNPEKFENMTYAEALNTAMKDQNIKDRVEQEIMTVIGAGWYETLKGPLKEIADQMWIDYQWAKERFDRTAEEKKWNVPQSSSATPKNNFSLKEETITWLDQIISKVWVNKAIELVNKNSKYTQTQKNRIINYLNSKK